CRGTLGRVETVTNAEVSTAIRVLWESLRCISEPSGAMGLAAVLKHRAALAGKRVLVVVTGANIDFLQLGLIAQTQGAGGGHTRTLRVQISERPGSMLSLLDDCFGGLNITDFQYGKTHAKEARPVFTVSADDPALLSALPERLAAGGHAWEPVNDAVDVAFRAVRVRGARLANPVFLRLDFCGRAGALHDCLDTLVRDRADLCYFNYRQSGERIGRALIGLDFATPEARAAFLSALPEQGEGYR